MPFNQTRFLTSSTRTTVAATTTGLAERVKGVVDRLVLNPEPFNPRT
ncbi:MAG: hypothetical protein IMW93_06410 [Thermoanaerobacteraceae bacterium]|nr:hypothetical protein [Thermoanaerobacteraceae bacterium]